MQRIHIAGLVAVTALTMTSCVDAETTTRIEAIETSIRNLERAVDDLEDELADLENRHAAGAELSARLAFCLQDVADYLINPSFYGYFYGTGCP